MFQVVGQIVRTIWLWLSTSWVPGRPRRGVAVAQLLRYGGQFVPTQLLAHVSRSLGEIIVGATSGASELGIYRRAHSVVMMTEQLKNPLKFMMPASLSRLQDQPADFFRFYLHSLTIWSLVACGAMGFVAAEASLVVGILLGDQWSAATPLIRALAPVGLAAALGSATEWMLLPLAEMRKLILLRVVRTAVVIGGVLLGWSWGLIGIAIGLQRGSSTQPRYRTTVRDGRKGRVVRRVDRRDRKVSSGCNGRCDRGVADT